MRVNYKLTIIFLGIIVGALASCSYDAPDMGTDNLSLESLKKLTQDSAKEQQAAEKGTTIRGVALYEMALSMGMRAGLYNRAKEINNELLSQNTLLDEIFDFRGLILKDRIIPPVLIEARKTMDAKSNELLPTDDDTFLLNNNPVGKSLAKAKVRVERAQNNFTTLRITDRVYKIIRQARFAVTVPSWRDYLTLEYTKPMPPESAVLPKEPEEQESWVKGIEAGWKMGLAQADQIFVQNLMLLRRDYLGMVRYRKLLAMNMVSAPYVAKRHYGVTGDGDEIKINDKVLTITALPSLKVDSNLWRPYIIQDTEQELDNKLSQLGLDKTLKYLSSDSYSNSSNSNSNISGIYNDNPLKRGTNGSNSGKYSKGFINPREAFNK